MACKHQPRRCDERRNQNSSVSGVIGCVRQKYTILGHGILVPIDYLKSTDGAPCLLDKIAFVCCAFDQLLQICRLSRLDIQGLFGSCLHCN